MGQSKDKAIARLKELITKTISDLEQVNEYSKCLPKEDASGDLPVCSEIIIECFKDIKNLVWADNFDVEKNNLGAIDEVCRKIMDLRQSLFLPWYGQYYAKYRVDIIKQAIKGINLIQVPSKSTAKKSESLLLDEDELSCAVYVMKWLERSQAFLSNLKLRVDEPFEQETEFINPYQDEIVIMHKKQIDSIKAETRDMSFEEYEEQRLMLAKRLADEKRLLNERIEKIEKLNKSIEEHNEFGNSKFFDELAEKLTALYDSFTADTLMSYKKRKQLLCSSNFGDLEDIYKYVSEANRNGNVEQIIKILNRITDVITEVEKHKAAVNMFTQKIKEFEKERIEEEKEIEKTRKILFGEGIRDELPADETVDSDNEKDVSEILRLLSGIKDDPSDEPQE